MDSSLYPYFVPPYYDSLVAKLIVHAADAGRRDEPLRRALEELPSSHRDDHPAASADRRGEGVPAWRLHGDWLEQSVASWFAIQGATAGTQSHQTAREALGLERPEIVALSPTPMACTGSPNVSASATTTPPRAVPSSLVTTRPVTSIISRKISTCCSAFWPVVASSTSSTVRRGRVLLFSTPDDLPQLVHQHRPCCAAARRCRSAARRRPPAAACVSAS